MNLLDPLSLGPCQLNGRVMFGPHVTNLGDDERRFTPRHTAYYNRRAAGGCSVIVTEGASVHDSDWPYERAPLARRCAAGWSEIAAACHSLVSERNSERIGICPARKKNRNVGIIKSYC